MSYGFGRGFGFMFSVFPILFLIVFAIVIGTFIVTAVRGAAAWNKNNHSPRLTVSAGVVAKRTSVTRHRRHHSAAGMGRTTSSTQYYATFQVDSGDRMEFSVSGAEYGMLAEGDRGSLTFQGARYLSFERA